MYIPDRGDIIRVNLNPTIGSEIQGDFRPVLVVSPKRFNTNGLALICPITQGNAALSRHHGFYVSLMGLGLNTLGGVAANQTRTIDWRRRGAKKIETAPQQLVEEVQDILNSIIND